MGAYLLESGALGSTGRRGGSDVGGRGPTPLGEVGYSGGNKRRMARRREPAQALPGTASRQVPTKHVPARLAPGGATPAETRRRGVRRTGYTYELYRTIASYVNESKRSRPPLNLSLKA